MRIYILSHFPKSYSTRRLREACQLRGHKVRVLDTLRFAIYVDSEVPRLTYDTKGLARPDAIIPRLGASITFFGAAVVRQFERMGVFSINPAHAITVARDKLLCLQALSRNNIGMPATAFVRDKQDILPAIRAVGGTPVIIKLLEGTQGIGVILAEQETMAQAIIETLQSTRQNVLVQRFVAESKGKDIRALVVGDRVVAAMRRRARGQEFRSNVHRGGVTEAVELDQEYAQTAVRAAQLVGLRFAGVDMLEGLSGPEIMEVNASPGLEGIETATAIDVAGAVIDHMAETLRFHDIDIRQRLGLARGYTIAEILVNPKSSLAGQKLVDTGLRAKDVMVLSINREGTNIPNPSSQREILAGDTLLCYGKRATLATLISHPESSSGRGLTGKKASKA